MISSKVKEYIAKHPSGRVKIGLVDIDGVLRGKYISADKFLSSNEQLGFCDVVFGWDSADATYDNTIFTGWHSGYPDRQVRIDPTSFRKIPWEDDIPFFLAMLQDDKNNYPCPRSLFRKVVDDAVAAGYIPFLSQEFEWFNYLETPQTAKEKGYANLTPLSPGMFGYSVLRTSLNPGYFDDLFSLLKGFGIPLEGLHTETGPGVLEAAIDYAQGLEAGDRASLFKSAVKEIAYQHGILATFMAKVSQDLPGCSGHIHQSLWDRTKKKNLFYDKGTRSGMSRLMESYIAGQLACMNELLPMYAPTINSYKRLVKGAWAPTTLTWAHDNRTVALRVLTQSSKSARLETRVVGSDANPYLAMAAALASGLYGIRKKLKLTQPPTSGNGYDDPKHGVLHDNLIDATLAMKNSGIAKELFGKDFVDHFTRTRMWEWQQHLKAVTDWELKRYFEII